ncbi:MAG TPA: hypothetical protein VGG09_03185, partial [Acidimicrobiales bacterium]
MTNTPDFRSDPSESPEGRGIAYGRHAAFWKSLPESVRARANDEASLNVSSVDDLPAFIRDQVTSTVAEDADLIGFWVAWHKAGDRRTADRADRAPGYPAAGQLVAARARPTDGQAQLRGGAGHVRLRRAQRLVGPEPMPLRQP